MRSPEFRDKFYTIAREKLSAFRRDGDWRVDKTATPRALKARIRSRIGRGRLRISSVNGSSGSGRGNVN